MITTFSSDEMVMYCDDEETSIHKDYDFISDSAFGCSRCSFCECHICPNFGGKGDVLKCNSSLQRSDGQVGHWKLKLVYRGLQYGKGSITEDEQKIIDIIL